MALINGPVGSVVSTVESLRLIGLLDWDFRAKRHVWIVAGARYDPCHKNDRIFVHRERAEILVRDQWRMLYALTVSSYSPQHCHTKRMVRFIHRLASRPATWRRHEWRPTLLINQQLRKISFFQNTEVANSGSVARDMLATERTFLAWARTGLGFVGAGSALAAAYHRQDAALAPSVLPASALLIGNGAFLLAFATRRYYQVLSALRRDMFPINTLDTIAAVFITSANTVISLVIVSIAEMNKQQQIVMLDDQESSDRKLSQKDKTKP